MAWLSTSSVDLSVANPLGQEAHNREVALKLDQSTIILSHLEIPTSFAPLNNDNQEDVLDS